MEPILVTGGAGRLAGLLRRPLAQADYAVRLTDRRRVGKLQASESFLRADLTSAKAMRRACQGVAAVVHLGGIADEADWKTLTETNIGGLVNVLEAAREAAVPRFVFASSMHVLGMHPRTQPIDENSAIAPDTRYAATKVFGEAACRIAADKSRMAVSVLRIGHVVERVRDAAPGQGIAARDFTDIVLLALGLRTPGYTLFHAVAPHPGYPLSDGRLQRDHGFRFGEHGPDRAMIADMIGSTPTLDAIGRTYHGGDVAQRR